jgi:hypothetical protein
MSAAVDDAAVAAAALPPARRRRCSEGRAMAETVDASAADRGGVSRRTFLQAAGAVGLGLATPETITAAAGSAGAAAAQTPVRSTFVVMFEEGGIASLRHAGDTVDTEYVTPGSRLGDVLIRHRRDAREDWRDLDSADASVRRSATTNDDVTDHSISITGPDAASPAVDVRFTIGEASLGWRITVRNPTTEPLEIGDLAIPLPINLNRRRQAEEPTSPPVLKHSLVSGDGSFLLWSRANSVGPYLLITPDAGTKLEYWESQGGYRVFVHSAAAGAAAATRGTDWRQPHTSVTLAPGEARSYAFTIRWADDYDHARDVLVEQGLIDVHVVPGMTVPRDLAARIALRTNERIHGVDAEHAAETTVRRIGRSGAADIYEVRFERLGENRLTVRFGDGRHMHLEFFSTEPVETLIDKRGAFIASHQHRDASLWYDGLLAEWAMDTHVLLGPDNYDRIRGWRIYEVTCDDPGLSKPAFLAAKNAERPVQREVEALDDYIENFVWGGLQRTTDETFAYGIYGIPDWKQNRESADPGRNGRQHLWRIYDYPHITLMYYGLYRVAKHHPHIRTALTATQYLRRAAATAVAMFTVPWEIERWSAYGTGLMNELVIEDVLAALDAEGMRDEADRLRPHWERKVRTFVNDRPDLFRSEYAFDTTGFETTHALAKHALRVAQPEEAGDAEGAASSGGRRSDRITPENAQRFMDAQMAANLFCRGWLETAYYLLGSDIRGSGGNSYTLTYMAQMGGWSVLDYALYHAADPFPYLRLGYASYLSAWALMNTGTPESNYGYWYPGPENDGGAGGGFEPAPFGQTWLEQPHTRGSWYYSCEIDLGFCGALRCARTVLADDPLFGRFCFGGDWRDRGGMLEVTPRDGLRRRFHALVGGRRLHVETNADRFAADRPIALREDLTELHFQLEAENAAAHTNAIRIAGLSAGSYRVTRNREELTTLVAADGGTVDFDVPMDGADVVRFALTRVG